jgi:hypothetical protein
MERRPQTLGSAAPIERVSLAGYEQAVFSGISGVAVLFAAGWNVGTSPPPVTLLAA